MLIIHRILVADDDEISRVLLNSILSKNGYDVICCTNGTDALAVMEGENPPHLAILDWEMPGMTGLDICRRVRVQSDEGYVYVILLTARQGEQEIQKAFKAGVDDFLTKPITKNRLVQRLAVGSRVIESEIHLLQKQKELSQVVQQMEALAEERAQQLVHTERLATLGTLAAGVAHEINNPSTFISGNLKLLEECWPVLDNALSLVAQEDRDQAEFLREEGPKIIQGALVGVDRIKKIVDGLKTYSHPGSKDQQAFDLVVCAENALTICSTMLKHKIVVEKFIPENPVVVFGNGQQIEQVLINLINNSVDAMDEDESGRIGLHFETAGDQVVVEIKDTGPGFKTEILNDIWKPFFTTKEPGKGTGLGLSIVQRIIRNHKGEISATNNPDRGASIRISLPLNNSDVHNSNNSLGTGNLQRVGS